MTSRHWIKWFPDWKSLDGKIEVYATIPPLPREENSGLTEEELEQLSDEEREQVEGKYELSEEVEHWIWHLGEYEIVSINQKENVGKLHLIGEFEFDGEKAWVEIDDLHLYSEDNKKYQVADTVCFGKENCPENVDMIPPEIEEVKIPTYNNTAYFQAKITDVGTGVAQAAIFFDGVLYPMTSGGNDQYGVNIPYQAGIDLNYYILAQDGAGNKTTWNPVRGYVTRGTGWGLGIPPWAFWKLKRHEGGAVGSTPPEGWDPCSTCAGDPFDTMWIRATPTTRMEICWRS